MKIKTADDEYLKKAENLSDIEVEKLQCRMGSKLYRRAEDKKLTLLEALAIQLEIEDKELMEWREKRKEVVAKNKKK
ncbi:MAG: hypothetical protein ACO1N8_03830 [Methylophilus sp.]